MLNGVLLPDNSRVFLGDIGEGSSALLCLTDRLLCCSTEAGANRGRWEYGSDSVGSNTPIYSNKGFSSILLNRRSSALGPVGVYRCVIPDAGNILWSLTITVNGELEVFAEHEVTSNNGLSVFIPSQYPENLLLATI